MRIEITDLQQFVPIPPKTIRAIARAALGNVLGSYSVVLLDDAAIRDLNRRHRGRDRVTDVLAFHFEGAPLSPDDCAGEIIVSAELAAREARRRRIDPNTELALYVAHGFLHLAGLDDATPRLAARMRLREREILQRLGFDTAQLWSSPESSARTETGPRPRRRQ